MPKSAVFHVNYYVGAMLAQGGDAWLDDTRLIFSPTSMIDRAMGAQDVEIPFGQIKGMEFKGDVRRVFTVTTAEKTHKFEGSQAKSMWDILERAVHPESAKPVKSLVCDQCSKNLEAGFSFCPACGTRIKAICQSCRRAVAAGWAVCAFCGWKFGAH